MPDALQDALEQARVRKLAVHQLAHVREADIALVELGLCQNTNTTRASIGMAFECEIDLFDTVLLRRRAELGFSTLCRAAEKTALFRVHADLPAVEACDSTPDASVKARAAPAVCTPGTGAG